MKQSVIDGILQDYLDTCRGDLIELRKLQALVLEYMEVIKNLSISKEDEEALIAPNIKDIPNLDSMSWTLTLKRNGTRHQTLSYGVDRTEDQKIKYSSADKLFHEFVEHKLKEFLIEAHHACLELLKEDGKEI